MVTFEPPSTWKQFRAAYVENGAKPPYLMKALDDNDSEWNLVEENPRTTLQPSGADEGTGFLPEATTFKFADDSSSRTGRPDGSRRPIRS